MPAGGVAELSGEVKAGAPVEPAPDGGTVAVRTAVELVTEPPGVVATT